MAKAGAAAAFMHLGLCFLDRCCKADVVTLVMETGLPLKKGALERAPYSLALAPTPHATGLQGWDPGLCSQLLFPHGIFLFGPPAAQHSHSRLLQGQPGRPSQQEISKRPPHSSRHHSAAAFRVVSAGYGLFHAGTRRRGLASPSGASPALRLPALARNATMPAFRACSCGGQREARSGTRGATGGSVEART